MKLQRYKQNLSVEGDKVYSYNTEVGTINRERGKLYVYRWYSMTTSKHINYVARELGLEVKKLDLNIKN